MLVVPVLMSYGMVFCTGTDLRGTVDADGAGVDESLNVRGMFKVQMFVEGCMLMVLVVMSFGMVSTEICAFLK